MLITYVNNVNNRADNRAVNKHQKSNIVWQEISDVPFEYQCYQI